MKATALSEAHIEQSCSEWLALDGWRRVITDPPKLRGMGVTEKGITDGLYIRYAAAVGRDTSFVKGGTSYAEVLWIEWKRHRPGRRTATKAMLHQLTWIAAERARGALVWLAGVDFPATIEGCQEHYRNSGLMRRRI